MPLKAAIIPHLDEITAESKLTGAVNTIVKVGPRLVGTNTDYLGILASLQAALGSRSVQRSPAAVIGGGATTRSAILALHRLGLGPIYLVNRDEGEVRGTIEWFAGTALQLDLVHLRNTQDVDRQCAEGPSIVVGAIPGESVAGLAESQLSYPKHPQSAKSTLQPHTSSRSPPPHPASFSIWRTIPARRP